MPDLLNPPITPGDDWVSAVVLNPLWGACIFVLLAAGMWVFRVVRNRDGLYEHPGLIMVAIWQLMILGLFAAVGAATFGLLDGVTFFRAWATAEVTDEAIRGVFSRTMTGTVWMAATMAGLVDLSVTFLSRFDRVRRSALVTFGCATAVFGSWVVLVLVVVTGVREPF